MPARRTDRYHQRRNLDRSGEPSGAHRHRSSSPGEPIFVIQHHEASTDHYDLRLEVGGVLKSWAVPKGPSTDPADRRLATPTDDHPMDYADFEGTIPSGEYGAGTVLVWDTGTYRNTTRHDGAEMPIEEALSHGHVTFELHGRKLHGGYALTRIRSGGGREAWLLVKESDRDADARRRPTSTQPESVLSGREPGDIAGEES